MRSKHLITVSFATKNGERHMLEIWRAGGSNTGATPELARSVEAEGWDGQMFMDSQCLSADPYAQMGVWACSTERYSAKTCGAMGVRGLPLSLSACQLCTSRFLTRLLSFTGCA